MAISEASSAGSVPVVPIKKSQTPDAYGPFIITLGNSRANGEPMIAAYTVTGKCAGVYRPSTAKLEVSIPSTRDTIIKAIENWEAVRNTEHFKAMDERLRSVGWEFRGETNGAHRYVRKTHFLRFDEQCLVRRLEMTSSNAPEPTLAGGGWRSESISKSALFVLGAAIWLAIIGVIIFVMATGG